MGRGLWGAGFEKGGVVGFGFVGGLGGLWGWGLWGRGLRGAVFVGEWFERGGVCGAGFVGGGVCGVWV